MNFPPKSFAASKASQCFTCNRKITMYSRTETCEACGLTVHDECIDWAYYIEGHIVCDACRREMKE